MNIADQSTVGGDLMSWMLDACCRQAQEWREADLAPMVGVNISPPQLLAPGFAAGLARRVAESELSPAKLALELTESAWTLDSAEALEVIEDLRAGGFTMVLDDFGAGYSSLSRLVDLGFDVLKIDGRMLGGVPGDDRAVKLVEAVFDLASACATGVVAEGLETEAQLEFLLAHGIPLAQGFLLGAPMGVAEITALLRRHLVAPTPPRRGPRPDTGRV
jgi:EAL domain-containing protein (putative c-di-GMP-specific phosphodiesterase class I)